MEIRFNHTLKTFFHEKRFFIPAILAVLNAFATYILLTTDSLQTIFLESWGYPLIVAMNGFFIVLLLGLIFSHLYDLRKPFQDQKIPSRFRYRVVVLFILAALIPALLIAVFSAITFKKATDGWFDRGVETAIYNAQEVSYAYLTEHKRNITADAFATTKDLKRLLINSHTSLTDLIKQLEFQLLIRDLQQVILYSHKGHVIASVYAPKQSYLQKLSQQSLSLSQILAAQKELPATGIRSYQKHVYALLPFHINHEHYFIQIARKINPQTIEFQERTTKAVYTYQELKRRKRIMEIGFGLIYTAFGLAAISFMIHAGHYFAKQLTSPLERLTLTVQQIDKSEFYKLMPDPPFIHDEIDGLITAFNKMARSLQERQAELIRINQNLDVRRMLNETVLAGVSSGVIGMNAEGDIRLLNQRILDILQINHNMTSIKNIATDFAKMIFETLPQHDKMKECDFEYRTPLGDIRQLHIRMIKCALVSRQKERQIDYVITIDDVSDLLKAQSMAAWQDVARRIAHEIKNPLMPISLATQRISRRWGKYIPAEDSQIFEECVQTILRQVDHIRETTNSFADFAKMPRPEFEYCNFYDILQEVIFLEQLRCPTITYHYNKIQDSLVDYFLWADHRLLSQALINLLKNAAESIEQNHNTESRMILIDLSADENNIKLYIVDNGIGLPPNVPAYRLFDPYMTQKQEGTGLGLAITAKIIQEHHGKISLTPRDSFAEHHRLMGETGACVCIILEKTKKNESF